jgi:hypothetical protein
MKGILKTSSMAPIQPDDCEFCRSGCSNNGAVPPLMFSAMLKEMLPCYADYALNTYNKNSSSLEDEFD